MNATKRNETQRNATKRNKTQRNATKMGNQTCIYENEPEQTSTQMDVIINHMTMEIQWELLKIKIDAAIGPKDSFDKESYAKLRMRVLAIKSLLVPYQETFGDVLNEMSLESRPDAVHHKYVITLEPLLEEWCQIWTDRAFAEKRIEHIRRQLMLKVLNAEEIAEMTRSLYKVQVLSAQILVEQDNWCTRFPSALVSEWEEQL